MIELNNVDFLKASIDAISSFIPEGNFRFNDKGIHFRAVDPSQVVLVDYFIDKKVFDSYSIEPAFVGVNLVELSKIVSRSLQGDSLKLGLTDSELKINLKGELDRAFKLPLIDVSDDDLKIPEIDYDVKVEIDARVLKEALKDASLFSSSVMLLIKKDKFYLEAKGSAGVLNASSNSKAVKVKSTQDVVSKYSLGFLQNIVKQANPDSDVVLELKSDSPMKVTYLIGSSEIRFYLAHMLL